MKLGVICDGISRDLAHAIDVMDEFDLTHAELQFVGQHEVGDHSTADIRDMNKLLRDRGKPVSCLSRHIFAGLSTANVPGDALHTVHMDALKRVIDMAVIVGSPLVRIMTNRKEQILWGYGGAAEWSVANGAWDKTLPLIAPALDVARNAGITLVVETGSSTMINSSYTARKLIDDLGAKDVLQVLWNPANTSWCHERAYPDGYDTVKDGYLGHVHIKDVQVDTPRATLTNTRLGDGQLADQFVQLGDALRRDAYEGVVSLESHYRPKDGDFESGFRQSIGPFKTLFA